MTEPTMSGTSIPDDMVERAAREMRQQYDSEHDAPHLSWPDFEGDARRVLEAALGGPVVVNDPHWLVDTLWDSLNDSTNQGTDAFSYADVERAVRDVVHEARRLAAEASRTK